MGFLRQLRTARAQLTRWLDDVVDEPLRREGLLPPRVAENEREADEHRKSRDARQVPPNAER
jgi:hypothetical protein